MKRVVAFSALVLVGGLMAGCGNSGSTKVVDEGPTLKTVVVPAGIPVPLILLDNLDAGGSQVGRSVGLIVTEDVVVDGEVVIRKGATVAGEVTQSRAASLANAFANRPARLSISFSEVGAVDGEKVLITPFGEDVKEDGDFEFTQKNTAERLDAAKIETLWQDPESREALGAIADRMLKGDGLAGMDEDLRTVAERLGMEKTQELVDQQNATASSSDSSALTMGKAVDAMVEGNLGRLGGADAVLAAQALGEVVDLASSVDHKLRGMFKARTVRANVGTPVPAVVGEEFSVVVEVGG